MLRVWCSYTVWPGEQEIGTDSYWSKSINWYNLCRGQSNNMFYYFSNIYLFGCTRFSCSMWDLVPWPGIKLGHPALRAWSLSHWATREVLSFKIQRMHTLSPAISLPRVFPMKKYSHRSISKDTHCSTVCSSSSLGTPVSTSRVPVKSFMVHAHSGEPSCWMNGAVPEGVVWNDL